MLKRATDGDATLYCLGSGSAGNAFVLDFQDTCLLIDCGFSARETQGRMRLLGLDPARLTAVLVTHEHGDHVKGMAVLSRKLKVPVYVAPSTYSAYLAFGEEVKDVVDFSPGKPFRIGAVGVTPFGVPHDAADPVGFRLEAGSLRIGVATDLGHAPGEVREHLKDGDVLVLESNHDLEMLKAGPYPWPLKQRILSRRGHLSNEDTSAMLEDVLTDRCRLLVLAHISRTNNRPELARLASEVALRRLGIAHITVVAADQHRPELLWSGPAASGPGLPAQAPAGPTARRPLPSSVRPFQKRAEAAGQMPLLADRVAENTDLE